MSKTYLFIKPKLTQKKIFWHDKKQHCGFILYQQQVRFLEIWYGVCYIMYRFTLYNYQLSIQKEMFERTPYGDKLPLKRNWQAVHSGFNSFDFNVKLYEAPPNAKHQRITLSVQIIWQAEELVFRKLFKTSDLPSQAITIFSDVQTLFEYIDQFYNDPSRIRFNPEENTFTVVNIVVMKNKQLKQEIVLFLDREKLIIQKEDADELSFLNSSKKSSSSNRQMLDESKIMIQSIIKDQYSVLENKVEILSQHLRNFINEIRILKNQNKALVNSMNSLNSIVTNIQNQTSYLNEKVCQLQNQTFKMNQSSSLQPSNSAQLKEIKKELSESKWQLDQLNYSVTSLHESHAESHLEVKKIKNKMEQNNQSQQKNDQYSLLIPEMRKQIFFLNNSLAQLRENSTRLGHKVFINLEFNANKHINNFRNVENIVEKISGDEQRHQILGKEVFNFAEMKNKKFFEIKVISTAAAQIVIGVVGQARKGQRYSYDKKQCVCYDGQGFIFEQGQKIKMPCQFYGGQTIRVVLDPFECLIQWFVGYTEIGSVSVPDTMRKMKLYPYFELYCIGDKVAING